MSEIVGKNRIVINTLFLTIRMLFLMVVSFFTTRVVINSLGFIDYGIQNVVGGLTSMFVFFRSSLSNATQRFLNIELANNNKEGAKLVFRRHCTLYIIIAIIVVILAETIGLWFLYNKLVIPSERISAALWVYQFMIMSLVLTLISVVYNAAIVAHEDFNIYSYIGIFEGLSKLFIAYFITITPFDRLIFYSFMIFLTTFIVQIFYIFFCRYKYAECRFNFDINRQSYKDAINIIGWNTAGTIIHTINNQGMDILLNIFFGPIINAARGIAMQINSVIVNFVDSFYTSVRPQLVKSYATEDTRLLLNIFYKSSKYGFFILWIIALPVIFSMETLLDIWLVEVPEHTVQFSILIMCYSLINILNDPIWSLALAIGNLKRYILLGSSISLLSFPISYFCLHIDCSPESVFIVNIIVRFFYIITVFHIIREYVPLSRRIYLTYVIKPIIIVLLISSVLSIIATKIIPEFNLKWIVDIGICVLVVVISIWTLGLSKEERMFFVGIIKKILKK